MVISQQALINGQVIKILFLTSFSFILAVLWTPVMTHFLFKYKIGKQIRSDNNTPLFTKLHLHKSGTPTMGGLLIWMTTMVLGLFFFYLSYLFPGSYLSNLNFLTRSQTLLPLGCLVASALVGLIDDYLDVRRLGYKNRGIKFSHKLLIYAAIALVGALWFYLKLDWDIVHIPFFGSFHLGISYILFFVFVVVGTAFAVNQTDGLDGLAGGTLIAAFSAYSVLAFVTNKYDLAAFCGVISGSLLAFLWFNINPARFFMGDTGSMSLGITLALVALYTNTVFILPIIGSIFLIEAISTIVQILSKKIFGRKVFLSAPIHHHFEAKGWPETKIVMRFWIISGVTTVIGLLIFLLDKSN